MKKTIFECGNHKLDLSQRTHIMGILNITPDSFSDGGSFFSPAAAVEHALKMEAEGADIIDIGGESTRPGAEKIPAEEENQRVIPVLKALIKRVKIPVSIDTYKSEVAEAALNEGASIINDISGLHFDAGLAELAVKHKAGMILMHIKGTPKDMQMNAVYRDLIKEIGDYLKEGIKTALKAGLNENSIMIDPGIGFGKTVEHNLLIHKKLAEFLKLGYPVLMGTSRKSFIGKVLDLPVSERLEGSLASAVYCALNGASVLRVHNVKETVRAVKLIDAIRKVQE